MKRFIIPALGLGAAYGIFKAYQKIRTGKCTTPAQDAETIKKVVTALEKTMKPRFSDEVIMEPAGEDEAVSL